MDTTAASGTATVRALVWEGGDTFTLRALPMPVPVGTEAVVAVERAAVCGSDLHTVTGRRSAACPSVLGHESVGRVTAIGPDGRNDATGVPLAVGDRVVWSVTASCGTCDRCAAGHSAKCRTLLKTGHEPFDGPWPLSGGYASHVLLHPGLAVAKVPDSVPDGAAAIAACAVATVMACVDAAGPLDGRRVVVSGCGMLGLAACAVASSRGTAHVEARDPDPHRRTTALRFGADDALAPDAPATTADVVIELSGVPDAVAGGLARLDVGGRLVLAGSVAPRGTVAIDPEQVVRGLHTIVGVHNYEPRHLVDAVAFLAAHPHFDFDALVAPPVALDALADLLRNPPDALRLSVAPAAAPTHGR